MKNTRKKSAVKRPSRKLPTASTRPAPPNDELRENQRSVAKEQANLRAVFDVVNVAMVLIDENGAVQRVNDTVSRWTGRSLAALGDVQPGDLLGCIHALDNSAGCGKTPHCAECPIRNTFERVLRTGQPLHDVEADVILAVDGKQVRLCVEASADPLFLDGRRHVVLALNNITERKTRENELHRLNRTLKAMRDSSHAMMLADDEAKYLEDVCKIIAEDCGHAMVWIGFAQDDEGMTILPAAYAGFDREHFGALNLTWADAEGGRGPTGTAIRTGEPMICRNIVADSNFAPWREQAMRRGYASSIALPLMSDGKAFGAISIYSRDPDPFSDDEVRLLMELADDLAYGVAAIRLRLAHARSEELVRQTAEELARSNRDLEQFASVASHDLQEPLRTVGGFVQLLAKRYRGQLDAEADTFIEFIVSGVDRMQALIRDLLAYSRVGTRRGAMAPTDLGATLQTVLADLGANVEESAAEITHGPLPTVRADASQMAQLFQNLISNALKFRGKAPLKIHVEAVRRDDGWLFSVRDNGIGIAPEACDRIFQIFERLHSRDQYAGTGIGLAICKRIVDRHGGRIWVESQPDAGATFYFTLPL